MTMHTIDIDSVELAMDVMKYVMARMSNQTPDLGFPKSEEELRKLVGTTITKEGIGGEKALQLFKDVLVKATVAADHPRDLSFVPAAPSKASILFDVVTAASSIHGAYWMMGAGGIFCEMEAMKWLVQLTGMPETSFGVFTSGGTVANLSAMLAAREQWKKSCEDNRKFRSLMITSHGAHSSVKQMAKVIDADLLIVEDDENDKLCAANLNEALQNLSPEDRKRVFAVVCTCGTTNAGIIDCLDEIATVCERENIWMHVDGAYGGAALAAPSVRHQFKGIERANSVTIDPHKWLFAPYDCGAIIYRDIEQAKEAHTQKGTYLEIFKDEGAKGFNPSDYQIQLTRRARGLPLWFSLAMHGTDVYVNAIERGIELAKLAEQHIASRDDLELIKPASLSVVLFKKKGWTSEDYKQWTYENHKKGFALVAPTTWTKNGVEEPVARFCFINPDTTEEDIIAILDSMN